MDIAQFCLDIDSKQPSDLFLNENQRPCLRLNGEIQAVENAEIVSRKDFIEFFEQYLPAGTWEEFIRLRDYDIGVTLQNTRRFRINMAFQKNLICLSIRRVPSGSALDSRKLGIPDVLLQMTESSRGLILITGTTGSGKSTTFATLLNHINCNARKHIITLEDPIEFIHENKTALISQREIGSDCKDFHTALRHIVRQNPDAIFIGELRDLETISTAISAAMTGHLVVTTIHTADVQQTLERILNYFPTDQQAQIAQDLSLALIGIASQRLVQGLDNRRHCAFEILRNTPVIQRMIARRIIDSIPEIIKTNAPEGMMTFSQSLLELYRNKLISLENASQAATDPEEFEQLYQGMRTGVATLGDSYSGNADFGLSIKKLLGDAVHYHASDLILTVDSPPVIRLNGLLRPFDTPVLTSLDTRKLLFSILNAGQRAQFETSHEIDFALTVNGLRGSERNFRFRVNGFYQKGKIAAAFRIIPDIIPSPEVLGIPQVLLQLCEQQQGLILITGPTGHGKSTTLASLIDQINHTRFCHIITLEDPIEFVHQHCNAIIEQREIGSDSLSFGQALKYILRQDPDIILIGEMRDAETISAALTAAETGHLVFATLHTNSVSQSIDRIIDVFPAERQNQIRIQLAATLKAVVAQRLLPLKDDSGRIAAFEILLGTTAVQNVIREKKTHMLPGIIESSAKDGMITMERALQNLYAQGKISMEPLHSLGSISDLKNKFSQRNT